MRNSGKYLEDAFTSLFDKTDPRKWVHRFADTKSARNLIANQPADFLVCIERTAFLLECKSVKHTYRLPKFSQHSRMNRAAMAGMKGFVLVHHWQEDVYRVIDVSLLDIGKASFDLRNWDALNWEEVKERLL